MFRELELYAGSRLRVYIDGRVHKFLDDIEQQIVLCGRLAKSDESTIVLNAPKSCSTPIDLMLLLDTSSLSADEFYQEKQLAIDLLKAFPDSVFESRLSVSTISFAHNSTVVSAFGLLPKNEVIFELERTVNASGPASLPTATSAALMEIKAHRRRGSRIIVVIFSSGNGGKDSWREVKESAISLRSSDAEVFAVSLSATANLEKLKEYTGKDNNLYMNRKSDRFIQDVGSSILSCTASVNGVKNIESEEEPTHPDDIFDGNLIQLEPVGKRRKCVYEKMDLQIILDASSSRQEVFEHQKELALSLVERLPISAGGSKVAVGISSFTSVPIIRQTLGLGRNKKMVRRAIESIEYHGGSTLTAQAVDLTIDDLLRGRRPDAVQVVVLMNDGVSQDPWDRVLAASERLQSTKAEIFGVALGNKVDMRELQHYIGRNDRIYRDGMTEKFLNDVVNVLKGHKDCPGEKLFKESPQREPLVDDCSSPNLDLIVIFDNTDRLPRRRHSAVNANRYLLLDVLGSLKVDTNVRVSVISFDNSSPKVTIEFTDISNRDAIFSRLENIKVVRKKPSYSDAVIVALEYLDSEGIADAHAGLVILGNGKSGDSRDAQIAAGARIRETPSLTCFGVDTSSATNITVLKTFTGSASRVYPYQRTTEFAKQINRMANAANSPLCNFVLRGPRDGIRAAAAADFRLTAEWVYSTPDLLKTRSAIQHDILGEPLNIEELSEGKLIVKEKIPTAATKRTLSITITNPMSTTTRPRTVIAPKETNTTRSTTTRRTITTTTGSATTTPNTTTIKPTTTTTPKNYTIRPTTTRRSTTTTTSSTTTKSKTATSPKKTTTDLPRTRSATITSTTTGATTKPTIATMAKKTNATRPKTRSIAITSTTTSTTTKPTITTTTKKTTVTRPRTRSTTITSTSTSTTTKPTITTTAKKTTATRPSNRSTTITSTTTSTTTKPAITTTAKKTTVTRPRTRSTTISSTATSTTTKPTITTAKKTAVTRPRTRSTIISSTTTSTTTKPTITTTAKKTTATLPATTKTLRTRRPNRATTRTTVLRTTATTISTTSRAPTSPSFRKYFLKKHSEEPDEPSTTFRPGCLLDVIIVLDSSGSVEVTFKREKELAADIASRLRIGPNNSKVSIIKFAGAQQVKTVWSFADVQSKDKILRVLENIPFNSGTTAIHSALLKVVSEYTSDRGARPGIAKPIAIVFTDGFGQKPTSTEAAMLRAVIPDTYAIAINHNFPISRSELEVIVGDPQRVFTDANIGKFHAVLDSIASDCTSN